MAHARSGQTKDKEAADGAVCGAEPGNATADGRKSCFFESPDWSPAPVLFTPSFSHSNVTSFIPANLPLR